MKKSILSSICFCLCLVFLFGCSPDNANQSQEQEEIIVIVNGKEFVALELSEGVYCNPEILSLCRVFHLSSEQSPLDLGDCREYTVEATEDTEKIAALLSYFIWDSPSQGEMNLQLRTVVEDWGLSSDNRITAEWIVNNVDLAVEMIDYVSQGTWLVIHNNMDKLYDEYILGNTEETNTTNIS